MSWLVDIEEGLEHEKQSGSWLLDIENGTGPERPPQSGSWLVDIEETLAPVQSTQPEGLLGKIRAAAARQQMKPAPFPAASRITGDIFSGAGNTAASGTEALAQWATQIGMGGAADKLLKAADTQRGFSGDLMRAGLDQAGVENPTMLDAVAQGIGSSIPFMAIGGLAGSGRGLLGKSIAYGLSKGGGEAIAEGGSVFAEQKRQGASDKEALTAGRKAGLAQFPINFVSDALGTYLGGGGVVRQALARGLSEMTQETAQGVLSGLLSRRKEDGTPYTWGDLARAVPQMAAMVPDTVINEGIPAFISSAILGGAEGVAGNVRESRARKADEQIQKQLEEIGRLLGVKAEMTPDGIRLAEPGGQPGKAPLTDAGKATEPGLKGGYYEVTPDGEASRMTFVGPDSRPQRPAEGQTSPTGATMPFGDGQRPQMRGQPAARQPDEPGNVSVPRRRDYPDKTLDELTEALGKPHAPDVTERIWKEIGARRAEGAAPSGLTSRVSTQSGMNVDTRFKLVDADDLITSNTDAFGVNGAYPQELQPRQRGRAASKQQIESIISNLNPELLGESTLASDGAPIVGPDNVVESGNGRVMALRAMYRRGGATAAQAAKYRKFIEDNAGKFGVSPGGVKNPVLVRERLSDVDRRQFTQDANVSSVAAMSSSETAMRDAGNLNSEMLSGLDPDVDLMSNRDFIRGFARDVVPRNELGAFMDQRGRVSADGMRRVQNALFAKAYGDEQTLARMGEATDDNARNISRALLQASPVVATMQEKISRGLLREDLSLAPHVVEAANTLTMLRNEGTKVSEFLQQGSLFDDGGISPEARQILAFFDKNKQRPNVITKFLSGTSRVVESLGAKNQKSLFDERPVTLGEIIGEAEKRYSPQQSAARQGQLAFRQGEAYLQAGTEPAQPAKRKYSLASGKSIEQASPDEFVLKDGSPTWGHVTEELTQGRPDVPVGELRVQVGDEKSGIVHSRKHLKQINDYGIDSVEEFIDSVYQSADAIIPVDDGKHFMFLKRDGEKIHP